MFFNTAINTVSKHKGNVVARVVKPISLTEGDHKELLKAAVDQDITLKQLVESIIRLFIVTVQRGDPINFRVPQKVHSPRSYAISESVVEQVRKVSNQFGVSQVNFIYSALKWHLSSKNGVSAA